MEQLLWIRENIISYYKKFEIPVVFAAKLIAGLVLFQMIGEIGLWREEFALLFTKPFDFPFYMLMAVLFAILPPTAGNVLVLGTILLQISQSLEVAVFVFLLLVCVLAFYGRVSPKKSYLIIAMVVAFHWNLPYAVVLFAGLYLGAASVIPIAIGTWISSLVPFFTNLADTVRTPEQIDLIGLPAVFFDLYKTIFEHMTGNLDWVVWAFVLAMAALAVHAISKLSLPYVKEIAIGTGGLVTIIGMGIVSSVVDVDISMGGVIGGVLLSVVLVELVRLFDSILDYRRVERVQFEDEDNYYYVKVIPKIVGRHPAETKIEGAAYEDEVGSAPKSAGLRREERRPPRGEAPEGVAAREQAARRAVARRAAGLEGSGGLNVRPEAREAARPMRPKSDLAETSVRPHNLERAGTGERRPLPPVRRAEPRPKPDLERRGRAADDEAARE